MQHKHYRFDQILYSQLFHLQSMPLYHYPDTIEPSKSEEIRRTVYLSNLDKNIGLDFLHEFLSQIGEIRFIRAAYIDENAETRGAYVEFSEQPSIPKVLSINGFLLFGRPLLVNHATSCIIKPATVRGMRSDEDEMPFSRSRSRTNSQPRVKSPSPSSSHSAVEETVNRTENDRPSRHRSSSRSKSRKKSSKSTRSPKHRSRSRKRSRSRSSRDRKRRSRSRDRHHRKKDSRKRSRSRSRSKGRHRRSESSRKEKKSRR